MKMHIRMFAGALVLLTALGVWSPRALAERVLNRGNGGEPSTLDPHRTDGRLESNILRDVFEGLVVYGPDGKVLPGVAETWDISNDGRIYTFHLRPDARWSNGDRLTADDFLYSFRRSMAPTNNPSADLRVINNADDVERGRKPVETLGVAAPDPLTFTISLQVNAPYFLSLLAGDNSALPVHRASVEADPKNWARPGKLVSNGPYRLDEWKPKEFVSVVRNEYFHHAADIAIDRVVFHSITDGNEEVRRFQAGTLDVTAEVPQDRVKWLSLSQPHEFWNKPFFSTYYYAFNLKAEPFKGNRELRRALALAIDREVITDKVTRAGEAAAYGLVPPLLPNYHRQSADFIDKPMHERLAEARRLFVDSGYSPMQPLRIELLFNTSENNSVITESVISMWRGAFGKGIEVTPVVVEWTEYLKRRSNHDFQIARCAWIGDYVDPTAFLNILLSSAQSPRNDSSYNNPQYDALLAKAAEAVDVGDRMDLLAKAEKMMLADFPIIPIYHYATKSLVNPKLKGWKFNSRDVHLSRFLSFSETAVR